MKKSTRLIKRFAALFLVVLMSIDGFASIVSSNDGAAFVTKEAFEKMKENFDKSLDIYNDSITNKIDGKIAAYLSGLQIRMREEKDLPLKAWEAVTLTNYDIGNTWTPVELDCTYNWIQQSIAGNADSPWYQSTWAGLNIKNEKTSANRGQTLMLCDAGTETSIDPTNVTWDGVSKYYRDKITATITYSTQYNPYTGTTYRFMGTSGYGCYLCYWTKFTPGYYADLNANAATIWKGDLYFKRTDGQYADYWWYTQAVSGNITNRSKSCNTEIYITDDNDGKKVKKTYQHIIHWNNLTGLRLHDPDWIHHITSNPKLIRTNAGSTSNGGYWASQECNTVNNNGTDVMQRGTNGVYKAAFNSNEDNTAYVTVGLLGTSYESKKIYQQSNNISWEIDKTVHKTTKPPSILDGFVVFGVTEGDEITWKPVFKDTKYGNTVAAIASSNFELNYCLSYEPFTNGTTVTDTKNYIRAKGVSDTGPYIYETSSRKGDITFEAKKTGLVYCKWWPKDTSISSKVWEATLDLNKCGSYICLPSWE